MELAPDTERTVKTKMKKLFMTLVIALAVVVLAPAAKADTVVTLLNFNCGGNCPLASYTVTITPTGGSNYTVKLEIAIISGISSDTDQITSVNTKFTSDLTGVASSTLSLADSINIGAVTWTTSESNISNADCATAGQGFVCSQASGTGLPISAGTTYTWVWNVTLAAGATINSAIHIGANYDPANGRIVSQEVSVPEPGTIALLGAGLLGLAALRRRLL